MYNLNDKTTKMVLSFITNDTLVVNTPKRLVKVVKILNESNIKHQVTKITPTSYILTK